METLIILNENLTEAQKQSLQIAFEERAKSNTWKHDVKSYSKYARNIEEVNTHIMLDRMFDENISLTSFKIEL